MGNVCGMCFKPINALSICDLQWAKIVVVLERGFSKKDLLKFQKEYAIKLVGKPKDNLAEITDDEVDEQRALVVIKTSNKTKAKQRKGAVHNWKVWLLVITGRTFIVLYVNIKNI